VINQSIKAMQLKEKVVVVDLDIVNPYFRIREKREKLREMGIEVLAPPGKLALADLPLISPEIKGRIQDSNRILFIDVGGDEIGAKSLASFYHVLKNTEYQMNMVINPYRPFTKNSAEIEKMLRDIEQSSRLEVNGLISNPNLGDQTDIELIAKGHDIVRRVSKQLNLPIRHLTVEQSLYQKLSTYCFTENILVIQRYMRLPWDELN